MNQSILQQLTASRRTGKKSLAVLLDPDKTDLVDLPAFVKSCEENEVDFIFVGGSLIVGFNLHQLIVQLKSLTQIPVVLFPGSNMHIDFNADAILFLSLISGRNPELLIGQHVLAAPLLKKSELEVIATGYILVDAGQQTTVSYISNTMPVPYNKPEIAASTAMAGELLGLKTMYLDAGSGAEKPISAKMIAAVKKTTDVPLIVGGGINTPEKAQLAFNAGADVVVVGNALESEPGLLAQIAQSRFSVKA
jgi:putative glycerol-1-phosphate prenyltransferase